MALRLPPKQARAWLQELQDRVAQLHPFFQGTIPSLAKINDARSELAAFSAKPLSVRAKN
jgi:hypothetical protein